MSDTIFIGSTPDDLAAETACNMWRISLSQEETAALTTKDIVAFLDQVIENRRQQLDRAQVGHGLVFYLWFDAQAGQLRFNVISDFHSRLPFESRVNYVATPESIVERFLRDPYHDGIPIGEVDEEAAGACSRIVDEPTQPHVVDVYKVSLLPRVVTDEGGGLAH